MKMAGFYDESISNGLGWRAVLFVSGCPHHCPGCHNKIAQDYNYGQDFNEQEIIDRICENSILKGITISGGEPLCKENISEVLKFIKDVKEVRPNFNVWCYSGYTLEQLKERNDKETNETLKHIDVLVDGRFMEQKKNPTLKFRGSENQRILDIQKCLQENKIVEVAI
ncbi:MAG: anaerobic ribonucleoside-triphosphate reductase activating protein [Clostridiaceae bacterium]|nr:anaerobic ribonucleoside-triphosphate reductase activating protein [Clostridiaceae bacterium]